MSAESLTRRVEDAVADAHHAAHTAERAEEEAERLRDEIKKLALDPRALNLLRQFVDHFDGLAPMEDWELQRALNEARAVLREVPDA